MEFRVLGPLEVVRGGERLRVGTPRQRQLLGLLLVAAGAAVSVDRLGDELWPAGPPPSARHTIQGYVHRLRRVLGSEARRLETTAAGYRLKVATGELDAAVFEGLAERGHRMLVRGDAEAAAAALDAALELWRGTPYGDLGNLATIAAERTRLEAVRAAAGEDRVDAMLDLGFHDRVVPELERLVADAPFRERLWGQLMLAHYRAGRQADALGAFHRARRVLAEELGVEPGRWLRDLHERILLQDPGLDLPRAAPPPAPTPQLPVPRTSFVGRQRESAEVAALVRGRRLVTVTGAPGVGKSRLALEVARRLASDHPHGVHLVALAELADQSLVPSSIAEAVGLPAEAERPLRAALADHLRIRRSLLVLDDADRVATAAPFVAELLDAAPELRVLATARSPLRLTGEQEYRLGPLGLDAAGDAAGADAVLLFADRAASVDPAFALDAATLPAVLEVVARLDGLPLAVELAAACLRHLSLEELAVRVPSLHLLTGGLRDRPDHQRGLRDAIAWSESQLEPRPRAIFRRVGVFAGSFTAADAAAVGGGEVGRWETGLRDLVEASLVSRVFGTDQPAFRLLSTVREYARERLAEAGEADDVQERHAQAQLALLDAAAAHLGRTGQASWLERIDRTFVEIRAALAWSIAAERPALALRLVAGAWRYWQARGHLEEGRRWAESALALDDLDPALEVRALIALAGICYWQSDLDPSERAYRRALTVARSLGDRWSELEAMFGLVVTLACHRGAVEEAGEFESELQVLAESIGDPVALGMALATCQLTRLVVGDLEASRGFGERCLAGARELGERWYELQVLRTLALTSLRQGRHEQAREEILECLAIARELDDLPGATIDLDRLARLEAVRGRHELACLLAGAAERLRETAGVALTVAAFRWEQEPAAVTCRRVMREVDVERAWARGRNLELDEVVALAHG